MKQDSKGTKAKKEKKGKNMNKKSIGIGVKIYAMLIILVVSFFAYNLVSNVGMNTAKNSIENLSSTYMKLQEHNEVVSRNIAEIRLYSNLIVLLPDEESALQMAGLVQGFIDTINESVDAMTELSSKVGQVEIVRRLDLYKKNIVLLEENIMATANARLNGDMAAAAASNGQMRDIVIEMQPKLLCSISFYCFIRRCFVRHFHPPLQIILADFRFFILFAATKSTPTHSHKRK